MILAGRDLGHPAVSLFFSRSHIAQTSPFHLDENSRLAIKTVGHVPNGKGEALLLRLYFLDFQPFWRSPPLTNG